jgi:hypothetical protein
MKTGTDKSRGKDWTQAVEKALLRAGKSARKTAKMYGTPVYVLKQGKVVAERP